MVLGAAESRRRKPVAGQTSEWLVIRPECLIVSRLVDKRYATSGNLLIFQATYTRQAQLPICRLTRQFTVGMAP